MNQETIWTVLVTAITVLGSSSAWRFYERRAQRKEKDEGYLRDECRERIAKLEALLLESAKEKDEMRKQILDLEGEVASLRTEIKYLTDKNRSSI